MSDLSLKRKVLPNDMVLQLICKFLEEKKYGFAFLNAAGFPFTADMLDRSSVEELMERAIHVAGYGALASYYCRLFAVLRSNAAQKTAPTRNPETESKEDTWSVTSSLKSGSLPSISEELEI